MVGWWRAIQGRGGKAAMTFVDEQGAIIGVVSSHLDIVPIIITYQQDIGQGVVVGVDHYGIAVGGQLCFPG